MENFVEMVEFKRQRNASARRRAARARRKRIERLLSIVYRLIIVAAILMVMAGAGVIDSGLTATTQLYGALIMLGGFFVLGVSVMIYQEGEQKNGKL